MKSIMESIQRRPWLGWVLFLATLAAVFLLGLFGASILERRREAGLSASVIYPVPDWEPRNEVWGINFPREYETYRASRDMSFQSKYGGSKDIDYLEKNPRLVVLWAGYAFSRDYRQGKGHYHAIDDIRNTLRTGVPQPGTCWSCKSTDVPRVMNRMGVAAFYKSTWASLGSEIVNNIGCQDCHDNRTFNLRVTRPALAEAFQRRGRDIRTVEIGQMRSLACAQCHVEYYFKGKDDKYLTFPWDKGFSADEMEKYYDEVGHVDWVHGLSRAPMLKAQHPDYELYMTGVHSKRGVACADCHMPYRNEGGVKFTDHQIVSPLSRIASTCGVCHRQEEEDLRNDVYARQDRIAELLGLAEDALVRAHVEAKAAWDAGCTEEEMKPVLQLLRHAQWRWDWVAASNGMGFHSPLESARVLGTSIQKSQEAHALLLVLLARRGATLPVPMPDISTKAKAQVFVGLDMIKAVAEKAAFLRDVVPKWDAEATRRQGSSPSR